jgi:hypothetical protein
MTDEIAMFERIGKLAEENERLIGEIERLRGALTAAIRASEPGSMEDEARYHKQFEDAHAKGEWFRYEGGLRAFLEKAA